MKLIQVKRKTRNEKRYTKAMGNFTTRVTYVNKYILGFTVKQLYKYRETYYGEVKDCDACVLSR